MSPVLLWLVCSGCCQHPRAPKGAVRLACQRDGCSSKDCSGPSGAPLKTLPGKTIQHLLTTTLVRQRPSKAGIFKSDGLSRARSSPSLNPTINRKQSSSVTENIPPWCPHTTWSLHSSHVPEAFRFLHALDSLALSWISITRSPENSP